MLRCWERIGKKKQISLPKNEKKQIICSTHLQHRKHLSTNGKGVSYLSATHHSRQNLRSAKSPVCCSLLFYYKGELIYPFYREVEKRIEENFFQTLQELFPVITMNGGMGRLANICATCIYVYRILCLQNSTAEYAFGTKVSRSQRQKHHILTEQERPVAEEGQLFLP